MVAAVEYIAATHKNPHMKKYKLEFNDKPFYLAYITDLEDLPDHAVFTQVLGLDIETLKTTDHEKAGLDPYQSEPRLIQVYNGHTVYVFDCLKLGLKNTISYLNNALAGKRLICHYALFEIAQLRHKGFIHTANMDCTNIMSRILDCAEHLQYEIDEDEEDLPNEERDGKARYKKRFHSLDDCVQRELGVKISKQFQTSDWNKTLLDREQVFYAGLDAVVTYELGKVYSNRLLKHKMEHCYTLYKKMQAVIVDMHLYGIGVDSVAHKKLIATWNSLFKDATIQTEKLFPGINLASSKQMNAWAVKNIPAKILSEWPKTKKSTPEKPTYSFTQTSIAAYKKSPHIAALSEWKKYQKLISTYGESLRDKINPITDRLHPSYTLAETATSRLSCRDPNIQNQPRGSDLRSIFVPTKGRVLIVADFSQIELRLQGELSQDPVIRGAYAKKQDLYKVFGASLYHKNIEDITKQERQVAKTCVLALGYGMGPTKLQLYALNSGVTLTAAEASAAWTAYHKTFCVYSTWCEGVRATASLLGYATTLMGKRRKLDESEVYTRAPNHAVQGTAAELLFDCSISCKDRLDTAKLRSKLVVSCHDELVIESHPADAQAASLILTSSMCDSMRKFFPSASSFDVAEALIGNNWDQAKG